MHTEIQLNSNMIKILVFASLVASTHGIRCAMYSSADVVESVTRECADGNDAIDAGSGSATPCIHDCGDDVEFCLLSRNLESDLNVARCGDTYLTAFGTCTESLCICVTNKDADNVGKCNSASRVYVSLYLLLIATISCFFLL